MTNIIYGTTNQSQCRKCKRVSIINTADISSGDHNVDEILYDINYNNQIDQIADCLNNINNFNDFNSQLELRNFYKLVKPKMKWIPYSQIKNLTEIAKGGFGIIYKATWLDNDVAIKKFFNSQKMSKCFLSEVMVIFI